MKTRNLDVSTLFLITTSLIFSGILTMGSPNLRAQEKYLPLVGEWSYGSCNDVEVVENIAYMGNGTYFQTYDVVDKMNPAFLGEVKLPGIVDQIVIHNNLAFVAIDQDMQIVDISDPENPLLLGLLDRQFSNIVAMMPRGNYVFLMPGGYFEVIDVSDPANPIKIEDEYFDSGIKEAKLEDNLVYAANSQSGLQIFDVADPLNIGKVGELALSDSINFDPYSIEIRDNYAFLGVKGAGLVVVDISDPVNPVKVASIPPRSYGYNNHIALNGNHLYLADASYGEIYIFDITDVENPQELNKTERVAQIGSMKIGENYLYVARVNNYSDYFTGLQILSLDDPANPTQASFIATPEVLSSLKISEEKKEAYFGGYNVFILDITDKSNPKIKTIIQTRAQINDFTIVDNYMFTAMNEDGFGIYDITDPTAPEQVGHYNTAQLGSGQFLGYARSVTIKDNYAFVAISYAGLVVLDIADKTNPKFVTRLSEYGGHGMYRDGDYLYVSKFVFGRYIVDISDPINTKIIADPEEFDIPGGLFVRDNYAYIADTTLHVFDVADKSNPVEISSTHTGVRGYIKIFGNRAYIASNEKDSLFIYDVTDPVGAVPVDSVGLKVDGPYELTEDYLYTSARYTGVKIYTNEPTPTSVSSEHKSLPSSFTLEQNYPNPFNPTTVISYSLAEPGFVKLTVYDQLGREIQSLVDGHRDAGFHRVQFNGQKLASGVYFVKLQVNERSQLKKMTLIR
ncbi:MAG: T9SS type A sorting domain-containing protein [Deferribacteres bacterium]|nr:T9SS type A sorting domain-containing protein [candidate division KSB1 bacterium]MCB9503033.1 T9SS type A sorting domain-containing protein [Deferribacteres bacterium]